MLNRLLLNGREFHYYHFKANSSSAPILIIFHGAGYNKIPARFRDPHINVIAIMDTFGHENVGSWFLGEKGDFFWIEAVKRIIDKLKVECNSQQVFCWGSSMGGYAAILHGYLNNVTAIYANVPQTKLLGSTYIEHNEKMKSCLEYVFNNNYLSEYNDLAKIIKTKTDTIFIITFNQLEGFNYFSEQGFPFLRHIHGIRQKMYLEVRPNTQHTIMYSISESLDLFKKYTNFHKYVNYISNKSNKNSLEVNNSIIHLIEENIFPDKSASINNFSTIILMKKFQLNYFVNLTTELCWSKWIFVEDFDELRLTIQITTEGLHQLPALFSVDFDGVIPPSGFLKKSENIEIGFFNYISSQNNDMLIEKSYLLPISSECKRIRIGLRTWQDMGSVLNKLDLVLIKKLS